MPIPTRLTPGFLTTAPMRVLVDLVASQTFRSQETDCDSTLRGRPWGSQSFGQRLFTRFFVSHLLVLVLATVQCFGTLPAPLLAANRPTATLERFDPQPVAISERVAASVVVRQATLEPVRKADHPTPDAALASAGSEVRRLFRNVVARGAAEKSVFLRVDAYDARGPPRADRRRSPPLQKALDLHSSGSPAPTGAAGLIQGLAQ